MKLINKVIILLFVSMSVVFAQTVINAITAPANASGLCWVNGYLWCGAYGTQGDTIYKIDPANGNVLKRLRWRTGGDAYGLAFDTMLGGSLWVSDHFSGTDSIWLIDTVTGARLNAIRAHKEYMAGLANDGQNLWHCCYYSPDGRAYHINKATGAPFDSIDIPTVPQPWGATWDGQYLWVCNDGNYGGAHRIYKINVTTKLIIDSLDSPGIRPFGLAWDGLYLWVIANGTSPTGKVAYQIDLGGSGTPVISISPTSYNFNNVAIGQSPSFQLNVSNIGTDTLRIDTFFLNNLVFSYQTTTFPVYINPNSVISYAVNFTPSAFQLYTGSLGIVSDDPVRETVYVSLRGQGVYPVPTLSPSATSYNFGDVRVNCVKDWFLRIVNQGYPMLTIDSIKYNDARFFSGRMTLPASINCLETTEVQIITRPSVAGSYSGNIMIYSNSTPNPYNINLLANGIPNNAIGGQMLWQYDFPDNIVCVAPIDDINGDSILDVAAECYGTNMSGEKHLRTYWGNSSGSGVVQWGIGDADFGGGYGDDCLVQGDDYNNDGVTDILLSTAWGDRSVYAINSLTGQILWFYDSHSYDGDGGWVYSVHTMPDINNDGIGEVLAGIGGNSLPGGGPRSMYCFSGANGNIIWQFRALDAIGTVNWIPDVNNDGVVDAICGAWGNSYDKRVYCVSGASSGLVTTPIWQYQCPSDVQSVITIPDLNGDDKLEVVAGVWNGMVYCLSGANGTPIWTSSVGGWVVKLVAIPDLISANRPGIAVANVNGVIAFNVLNSNNGNVYWSYLTNSNVWTCDVIEDLNGDGKLDVITGNQTPGVVFCLSGADGNLIWSYSENKLIYSVRSIRDISGDGYQDVLVGTQGSTTGIGHVLAICGGYYPGGIEDDNQFSSALSSSIEVFPNPTITHTSIRYSLPISGRVSIKLYNAVGRLIETLLDEYHDVGDYSINYQVKYLAKGIYFLRYQDEINQKQVKLIVQ
jgi:outer membrane protein assembly factor BamB